MEPKETTTFEVEQFDEALENTPANVRKFLWSDEYQALIPALAKQFSLTEEKTRILDEIIFGTLTNTIDENEGVILFESLGLSEEAQAKLLLFVQKYFLDPAIELAKQVEITPNSESSTIDIPAPSPTQLLESIKSQFAKPQSIAPSVKPITPAVSNENETSGVQQIKKLDPYRESIE